MKVIHSTPIFQKEIIWFLPDNIFVGFCCRYFFNLCKTFVVNAKFTENKTNPK